MVQKKYKNEEERRIARREYMKQYYQEHKEKAKEYNRKYQLLLKTGEEITEERDGKSLPPKTSYRLTEITQTSTRKAMYRLQKIISDPEMGLVGHTGRPEQYEFDLTSDLAIEKLNQQTRESCRN